MKQSPNVYGKAERMKFKEEKAMKFEIIKNSQSETGYEIPDDTFYGILPGMVMGWQYEARNVCDKRFPVGKLLYFDVSYRNGMPEGEEEFMTFYANDLGWELTGRVVFRGYAREYYDSEEREWFVKDATEEEIREAREQLENEQEDEEECYEDYDYDLESGFDPYMGCYSYDC